MGVWKEGFIYTGGEFTLSELSVWALFHCSGKDVSLDAHLLEIKANKQTKTDMSKGLTTVLKNTYEIKPIGIENKAIGVFVFLSV